MNWDQVEGNWEQFKGKIREVWGKLNDDDVNIIKGKRQALNGKIQERYGYTKDVADKEIEKFMKDVDKIARNACSTTEKKKDSSSC